MLSFSSTHIGTRAHYNRSTSTTASNDRKSLWFAQRKQTTYNTSDWRETKRSAASSHIHSASTSIQFGGKWYHNFLRCFSITGGTIWPNNLVAVCDAKRFGAHSLTVFSLNFSLHRKIFNYNRLVWNLLLFFHKNLSQNLCHKVLSQCIFIKLRPNSSGNPITKKY